MYTIWLMIGSIKMPRNLALIKLKNHRLLAKAKNKLPKIVLIKFLQKNTKRITRKKPSQKACTKTPYKTVFQVAKETHK